MPEKKNKIERLRYSINLMKEILSPKIAKEKEFMWQNIIVSMRTIGKTHTEETEQLLVDLLESEDHIKLSPASDIPGALSPEDTLKSLAIQILSEWTGQKYVKIFKKICSSTQSHVLAERIKIFIQKLGGDLEKE